MISASTALSRESGEQDLDTDASSCGSLAGFRNAHTSRVILPALDVRALRSERLTVDGGRVAAVRARMMWLRCKTTANPATWRWGRD